jgi:hypothetical protein
MQFVMAVKMCYAIEQRLNFNSDQSYSIEKIKDKENNENAWVLKVAFQDSTDYWVIENLANSVKLISPEIHIEIIWEKKQMLLDIRYYEEKVSESLDKELRGLQLDEPSEHKEREEIGH